MKDFLTNPFVQKVIATLLGAGLYLLGTKFPGAAVELGVLAGGLGVGTFAYHMTPPTFPKNTQ